MCSRDCGIDFTVSGLGLQNYLNASVNSSLVTKPSNPRVKADTEGQGEGNLGILSEFSGCHHKDDVKVSGNS